LLLLLISYWIEACFDVVRPSRCDSRCRTNCFIIIILITVNVNLMLDLVNCSSGWYMQWSFTHWRHSSPRRCYS